MKYLLVLAVVLVAFWVWRNNRQEESRSKAEAVRRSTPRGSGPPAAMVACRQCGTHLPKSDAINSPQGSFCSSEHLQLFERHGRD